MSDVFQVCTYCGMPADSIDHVVPRHLLKSAEAVGVDLHMVFRVQRWTVPACRECNTLIGGSITKTLAERRSLAQARLKRKHRALHAMPDWSEEELSEMGPTARKDILAWLRKRDCLRARLAWRGASSYEQDISAIFDALRRTSEAT